MFFDLRKINLDDFKPDQHSHTDRYKERKKKGILIFRPSSVKLKLANSNAHFIEYSKINIRDNFESKGQFC